MTGRNDFDAEFSSLHLLRLLFVAAFVDEIEFDVAVLLVGCGGVDGCELLMVVMMLMRLEEIFWCWFSEIFLVIKEFFVGFKRKNSATLASLVMNLANKSFLLLNSANFCIFFS